MSISNEELVEKAVITTDELAAAGKLNPMQADRFIDYVVDESMLKNNARVVRFRNEQMDIDKIGIGKRVAVPKNEASDPGLRRNVNTSKVTLTPKTLMLPFEISDEFREINLEGDDVEDHVIRMMARQFANDLELKFIKGDVLGHAALESELKDGGSTTQYIKDPLLALEDGWLRLADGANIYDAAGDAVSTSTLSGMLKRMPTKFRRDPSRLRFFMSPDLHQTYMERLSSRATMLGDAATSGTAHAPWGVPIVPVPLMEHEPEVVEHVTLTGTAAESLRYSPVSDVVVTTETLGATPETPFAETTDWVADYANGTIARAGGSSIGSGDTVKVTYKATPQVLLTHMSNYIVGIGRDITIESDRDIYKGVNQYAITTKVSVKLEELSAIVKGQNFKPEA